MQSHRQWCTRCIDISLTRLVARLCAHVCANCCSADVNRRLSLFMFLHGIWYNREGKTTMRQRERALWTTGACAINRHRANIWSSTALAVACIRIVRAFMWELLKEDVVLVECVSYWVCGLCELSARKNQDRHFCPCPSMARLISFIYEPYSLFCVFNRECIHVHAHSSTLFIYIVFTLIHSGLHGCVCARACVVAAVVQSHEVSVRCLQLSRGECLHILHESSCTTHTPYMHTH